MKTPIHETELFKIVEAQKENEFIEKLKNSNAFTSKEIEAIEIMISYFRILYYPKLKEAMKTALCENLYNNWNGAKNNDY